MRLWRPLVYLWANHPWLRALTHCIPGHHSLASFFLPDRQEAIEIQGGLNKFIKMHANIRYERAYCLGVHEPEVQRILPRVVRPEMTVYNIGAHLGFFTLALNRLVGTAGHVVAFEPNPEVLVRLVRNLSLNGVQNLIQVEGVALGDIDGVGEFSLSLSDTQGRFADLPFVEPGSTILVPCRRLDTYVEEGNPIPDFILMDVEHAEGRVLRGMSRLLDKHKPVIVVELHGEAAIKESWQEFEKHDYRVARIPDMEIIPSVNDVVYGHYLAAHSSHLNRDAK